MKEKNPPLIQFSITAFAFLFIPLFSSSAMEKTEQYENILIHHVFFWLKDDQNESVRKQFEQGLTDLVKVSNINKSHIGIPASTEQRAVVDHTYSYSLMLIFKSKEDQDIYQKHPIHLKFIEENKDLWERVVVYDSVDK